MCMRTSAGCGFSEASLWVECVHLHPVCETNSICRLEKKRGAARVGEKSVTERNKGGGRKHADARLLWSNGYLRSASPGVCGGKIRGSGGGWNSFTDFHSCRCVLSHSVLHQGVHSSVRTLFFTSVASLIPHLWMLVFCKPVWLDPTGPVLLLDNIVNPSRAKDKVTERMKSEGEDDGSARRQQHKERSER